MLSCNTSQSFNWWKKNILLFFSGWIPSFYWSLVASCEGLCVHMVQPSGGETQIFQKTREENVVGRRTKMQRWTYGKFFDVLHFKIFLIWEFAKTFVKLRKYFLMGTFFLFVCSHFVYMFSRLRFSSLFVPTESHSKNRDGILFYWKKGLMLWMGIFMGNDVIPFKGPKGSPRGRHLYVSWSIRSFECVRNQCSMKIAIFFPIINFHWNFWNLKHSVLHWVKRGKERYGDLFVLFTNFSLVHLMNSGDVNIR